MTPAAKGLAVSVQTRLVRHARNLGVDPNLVLTRFAIERSCIGSRVRPTPSVSS